MGRTHAAELRKFTTSSILHELTRRGCRRIRMAWFPHAKPGPHGDGSRPKFPGPIVSVEKVAGRPRKRRGRARARRRS